MWREENGAKTGKKGKRGKQRASVEQESGPSWTFLVAVSCPSRGPLPLSQNHKTKFKIIWRLTISNMVINTFAIIVS